MHSLGRSNDNLSFSQGNFEGGDHKVKEDSKLEFRGKDSAKYLELVTLRYEKGLAIWWNIEKTKDWTWEIICARMKNGQKEKEKKRMMVYQKPL